LHDTQLNRPCGVFPAKNFRVFAPVIVPSVPISGSKTSPSPDGYPSQAMARFQVARPEDLRPPATLRTARSAARRMSLRRGPREPLDMPDGDCFTFAEDAGLIRFLEDLGDSITKGQVIAKKIAG
jgi:hypothetical protein